MQHTRETPKLQIQAPLHQSESAPEKNDKNIIVYDYIYYLLKL